MGCIQSPGSKRRLSKQPTALRGWLIFPLLLLAATAAPTPGVLKTFGDWIVGCDNGRACQAVALVPPNKEHQFKHLTMVLTRDAQPDDQPFLFIDTEDLEPVAVEADGVRIPVKLVSDLGRVWIRADDAKAFIEATRLKRNVSLVGGKLKGEWRISLSGMAAALLYMDEQQKRVGTVTALIGKGPGTIVPMPPVLPVIVSAPTSNREPRKLSVRDYLRVTKSLGCDPSDLRRYAAAGYYAYSYRLDAQTTLALLEHPCELGPYSRMSFALLIDEKGRVRPAQFDVPPGPDDDSPSNSIANAEWDYDTMQLREFKKGRGLLDCGTTRDFAWDGVRFRLVAQSNMDECAGSTDFIPTWRATVSRP